MTRKALTPSRVLCHHEAVLQQRMEVFVARGELDSARVLRKTLAELSQLRALAAATEQSGAWLN